MTTSPELLAPTPAFGPGAATPAAADRDGARARAAGYAAGWSQGAKAAQAAMDRELAARREQADRTAAADHERLTRAAAALEAAAAQLRAATAPAVEDVADAVLAAGLELATAVLGHEPAAATTPGADALRRALFGRPGDAPVTVRLNPADVSTLTSADTTADGVTVVADPALRPGDAVLVHALGSVEVLLHDALDRARAVLLP